MMNNELFATGGFNLDYFQIYNWGTFNGKIYTVNAENKSTLLTGENGSGKTTLVDALLTLLVPNDKRFYNQSSGEAKKRDRSEESYVLGAYGSMLSGNDESAYSSVQYLRKKENTISILNGCFTNPFENKSYTLLQIRYFTNSNLQQVFAITEGNVSLEKILTTLKENDVELIKNRKWKETLTSKLGTVFYFTFKQYVSVYSNYFGLRSEKALTLFSQIVGLKVLGDINSFIKYNMLEEGNILSEFDKLQDNYKNLVHCSNEIKKTKVQIEKFKSVNDTGIKYKEEMKRKENLENLLSTIPYWYTKNANIFLTEDLNQLNSKYNNELRNAENVKKEIAELDKEIASINRSISKDSTTLRLTEIENNLSNLNNEKNRCEGKRESYSEKLNYLNLKMPETEKAFDNTRNQLQSKYDDAEENENLLEDKIRLLKNNQDENNKKLLDTKSELESLGSRNSNIPTSNIIIREKICKAIKCDEEEIPFAGELIEVKKEEQFWKPAIEKVLHNFALTLIVPEKFYKKVSNFVNDNNMNGRVVYLQAEDDAFDILDDNIVFDRKSVGEKLNFKENHELSRWLKKYLKDHFSFVCADNINEYSKNKKSVTAAGLIKTGLKNEKDDRPEKNSESNYVLGWNNKEKRHLLSNLLDNLIEEKEKFSSEINKFEDEKKESRTIQQYCRDALYTETWDKINIGDIIKKIDSAQKEKSDLLKSNSSLASLNQALSEKENIKRDKELFKSSIDKNIGKLEDQISRTERELKEINNNIIESSEFLENQIVLLQNEYPRLSKPKNYIDLGTNRDSIYKDLTSKIGGAGNSIGGYQTRLTTAMQDAITPSAKIREQYGDWSLEFPDLRPSPDYVDDFIKVYNRLEKDDLPKYTKRFHDYLHTSLTDDFTNFQRCIQNQAQDIKKAIASLNEDLKRITYNQNPETYLQLEWRIKYDADVKEFNRLLKEARPDAMTLAQDNYEKEEQQFEKIQDLLNTLNNNERFKKKVLDIRNHFQYGAKELLAEDNSQKQYYSDSSSLSGGQKTKLTYTILAAAISYQFGIAGDSDNSSSFRFVIIDEAFSKIDSKNSEQVMKIFNELDIQVMVVTPNDKINVVEDYISSIHLVENNNTDDSRLLHMSISEYKEKENKK